MRFWKESRIWLQYEPLFSVLPMRRNGDVCIEIFVSKTDARFLMRGFSGKLINSKEAVLAELNDASTAGQFRRCYRLCAFAKHGFPGSEEKKIPWQSEKRVNDQWKVKSFLICVEIIYNLRNLQHMQLFDERIHWQLMSTHYWVYIYFVDCMQLHLNHKHNVNRIQIESSFMVVAGTNSVDMVNSCLLELKIPWFNYEIRIQLV